MRKGAIMVLGMDARSMLRIWLFFSLALGAGALAGSSYADSCVPAPPPEPDECRLEDRRCHTEFGSDSCWWCEGRSLGPRCEGIVLPPYGPSIGYDKCMDREFYYQGEMYKTECQQYGCQCNGDY
jgi:hypothetical protein